MITIVQCIFGALFLRLQYIIGVASLVVCIVSYIAQACYRSGASTLFGSNNPQNSNQYIAACTQVQIEEVAKFFVRKGGCFEVSLSSFSQCSKHFHPGSNST